MNKTEKIVATLTTSGQLEEFLNKIPNFRYEYKGKSASRRAKVVETLGDETVGFTVVYSAYTIAYIEDLIDRYIPARNLMANYYNDEHEPAQAAFKVAEEAREKEARDKWNSRSPWKKFTDSLAGETFYFYRQYYQIPGNVEYASDTVFHIASILDLNFRSE